MKNFDWTRYTKKIAVSALLHLIYAAWITAEELERWFLEQVEFYDSDNSLTGKNAFADKGFTYQ